MPSLSSTSSVFGRLTGKRPTNTEQSFDERLNPSKKEESVESEQPGLIHRHRRDSSILSIASSVTDLGQNVRRSVSLRSHRTQPSTSGSASISHRRFPSSGTLLTSPLTSTTVEDDSSNDPAHPQAFDVPKPRAKLSSTARSLSSKFKSSDALSTLAREGTQDSAPERPVTAIELPKLPPTPMLGASGFPRRAPERPALPTQASFSRDITIAPPNGAGSLHPVPSTPSATSGGYNPLAIFQQIQDTSAKRMATMDYMRRLHAGNVFYFSTLHYTPAALQSLPSLSALKMGRRANNYLVLGNSLPTVLDMNSATPLEYLKALSGLLQEFETYQSLSGFDSSGSSLSRGRVGQMFKSGIGLGKGRRASTATDSISILSSSAGGADNLLGVPKSAADHSPHSEAPSPVTPVGHDFQYLVTPHLPFEPDFATTFATLCDTLINSYSRLLELVSTPEQCGPGVGEAFAKADKAVRKILVANVVREFEDSTRAGVKSEVAGLGRLVLGGLT